MTTDVWQITTQSLEEVEKTIPLCSGSVQIIDKAAIIDAAQIVKIPQCHGIGFLGRFVLLYRDFINVADRRKLYGRRYRQGDLQTRRRLCRPGHIPIGLFRRGNAQSGIHRAGRSA